MREEAQGRGLSDRCFLGQNKLPPPLTNTVDWRAHLYPTFRAEHPLSPNIALKRLTAHSDLSAGPDAYFAFSTYFLCLQNQLDLSLGGFLDRNWDCDTTVD